MEILHIEEFVVLADVCNYGRAADALFISQSSLFNHVKALETELGVSLFDRKGKNIVLSDYGQIFLPYAKTIISAAKEYSQVVQQNKNHQKLRIGTQYRTTELIKSFCKKYPDYELHIFDNYDAMESLDQGICELAFIRDMPKSEESVYNILPYLTDTIVAATYASHPLARRAKVHLRELRKENFVMISLPQIRECYAMRLCKQAGFIPRIAMTAVNGSEAARLVNDEVGVSLFLKGTIVSEGLDNLALIDLDPPIECHISLCWRKDTKLSDAGKAFVEFVKSAAQSQSIG